MSLSREDVLHVAKLARVRLSEEDVAMFREQLSEILQHFDALGELDTEGVPPTSHPFPLENVMREDEVRPSLATDEVLANAPLPEGDSFRVRAVLDE